MTALSLPWQSLIVVKQIFPHAKPKVFNIRRLQKKSTGSSPDQGGGNEVLSQFKLIDLNWACTSNSGAHVLLAWAGASDWDFLFLLCIRLSIVTTLIKVQETPYRRKNFNIKEVRHFGVDLVYIKHWFPFLICHILHSLIDRSQQEYFIFRGKIGVVTIKALGLSWKWYGHTQRCFGVIVVLQWLIDHRISSTANR